MKKNSLAKTASITLFAAIILFSTFALNATVTASSGSNWPMFHNDLNRTGYTTDTSTATSAALLWNFTTNSVVSASPAVADGRLYIGSDGGVAYCLNAEDGSQIWNYTVHTNSVDAHGGEASAISSSMAVWEGYVYFGCYDQNVYCLNASSGAKVWTYPTDGTVESSPAIVDGNLYVGSWDGNVYCLNARTGDKIWNYTTGSQVESSPAVADGKVYAGSVDGKVYCLDAASGSEIWVYSTGNLVQSSPAVVDGRVYIGSEDMYLYCLDAANGNQIWNYSASGWVDSSPAVANGYVYFGCTVVDANQNDIPSNIYCLNAGTGEKVWNYTMQGGASYCSPAVADGLTIHWRLAPQHLLSRRSLRR